MVDTVKLNNLNKKLFMLFLIIQPALELFESVFGDKKFVLAGVSFAVVLRYVMFLAMFVLAVIANFKRKAAKAFIAYIAACGVLCVLQYINLFNYDVVLYEGSIKKNILQVVWYAARYAIAVGVIFLVYLLKFDYKDLKITVSCAVAFVVLTIIITNVFRVDYIAYKYGSTDHPLGNIFSWFTSDINKDNWRLYTSRGLFSSGNSLASFLSLLLPVTAYVAFKEKKIWTFGLVLLHMLAMIMVGTRVATYGAVLLFIMVIFIWVFDLIFNKKKINKRFIYGSVAIVVVIAITLTVSPFISRIKAGEGLSTDYIENENTSNKDVLSSIIAVPSEPDSSQAASSSEISSSEVVSSEEPPEQSMTPEEIEKHNYEVKIDYIKKNHNAHSIQAMLIYFVYPLTEHTDFWFDLMTKVDFERRNSARKIKVLILEDVVKTKGDLLDRIVGIGGVSLYPETDIYSIYYYFGILGVALFLMPFIAVLVLAIINVLKRLVRRDFDPIRCVLILSLGFVLALSHLSGHTLLFSYVNIFVGLVCGMIVKDFINNRKMEEKNA